MDDQYLDDQVLPTDKSEEGLDGELSFGDEELKEKKPAKEFEEDDKDPEDEILSLDDVAAEEDEDDDDDEDEDE